MSLNQNLESLQLLSQNTINHHRKKFNYIHIRLVQVAIKPLFRLGLDIPVFVCLMIVLHLRQIILYTHHLLKISMF